MKPLFTTSKSKCFCFISFTCRSFANFSCTTPNCLLLVKQNASSIPYVDVCLYFVLRKSPYTEEDMVNYKSLDIFINFQNGWVREVLVAEINTKKVIIRK